uniref:Uncharacterized protein n=1 Tax=Myotis myotis TaxID=51298 RepID=A0A7J7R7V3_MYOMY|nr:hypothetical protein mMyoMyo1_017389 [Myotis myotis]
MPEPGALPCYQSPPHDPPTGPWGLISYKREHRQPGTALPESLRESSQPGSTAGTQREQRPPVTGTISITTPHKLRGNS